jgi:hypothetical protein
LEFPGEGVDEAAGARDVMRPERAIWFETADADLKSAMLQSPGDRESSLFGSDVDYQG